MRGTLDAIAHLVSGDHVDALGLVWSALHFQHAAAIRTKLAETYAPATCNKMLSALRGVLRAAHQLGQTDADDYTSVASVASIEGEQIPAGRDIPKGELHKLMAVW